MPPYTGVYEEAAPLYKALARASIKSKQDPDWSHIRDRLDEVTSKYEELIRLEKILGWNNYQRYSGMVSRIGELEERWDLLDQLLKLEDSMDPLLVRVKTAYNYVVKTRIASFLAILLVSVAVALSDTVLGPFLLALASMGLSLSAVLLILHRLAHIPIIIADILLIIVLLTSHLSQVIVASIILAIITTLLTVPLPVALRRLLMVEGRS